MNRPEKTWDNPYDLAVAIEERVLCGHKRIVLTSSTALWFAHEIQKMANRQRATAPVARSLFNIDLYTTGSCIMTLDAKDDILEILAWAKNSTVARAAFERLCRMEPNYTLQQRRRSWVEEERIVKPMPAEPKP